MSDCVDKAYVCGILPMGPDTPETVTYLRQLLFWLIDNHNIREVVVAYSNCFGEFRALFTTVARSYRNIQFTILTNYPKEAAAGFHAEIAKTIPGFIAIENMEHKAKFLRKQNFELCSNIISRSYFCICNLKESSSITPAVRRQLDRRRAIEVFDFAQRLKE